MSTEDQSEPLLEGKSDTTNLLIDQIPFVANDVRHGRMLISGFFHDGARWRAWTPVANGKLLELQMVDLAEGFYFAKQPHAESDAHFQFLEFVAQHVSFPELRFAVQGIMEDIANLSASLAKLQLLHESRDSVGTGIVRMVATEVEYILSACRSIFDLLQEFVSKLWKSVTLHDAPAKKQNLKESFSSVALYANEPATREGLIERYAFPPELADFYVSVTPFFLELRTIRDNLLHHGSSVQTIFSAESDFLISERLQPFKTLNIWRKEEHQPNNLVPLRPAIHSVIYRTLSVCEQFSVVMKRTIQLPSQLVPDMHLFMRGPFNASFIDAMTDAMHRESNMVADVQADSPATPQKGDAAKKAQTASRGA